MKKFDTPQMERINLVTQNIMAASYCSSKLCTSYSCSQCDDEGHYCGVLTPCDAQQCTSYLCHYYEDD